MNFKAIIFDLDGTLLDTLEDLSNSMNVVLGRYGFPNHTPEEYKYFIGNGISNLVLRSLPEKNRDNITINNCLVEMRNEYSIHWAEKTKPFEGINELLIYLNAKKIKFSVLSNKPDEFTKLMVARFLPQFNFELVFGERLGIPRIPDPAAALEIAEILNISPDSFLYLGDSGTDMLTASAAGMYPIGALWGFRKAEELVLSGAKMLIHTPLELQKFFI